MPAPFLNLKLFLQNKGRGDFLKLESVNSLLIIGAVKLGRAETLPAKKIYQGVLTLRGAAMFAFLRAVFDSPGALRANLRRARPVDYSAEYHQSNARQGRAAARPDHRSKHASDDGTH